MNTQTRLAALLLSALVLPVTLVSLLARSRPEGIPSRPQGPCDIYAEGGSPCVAAHSSTRALYASYVGPLYQVMRMSDRRTLDIGVVPPSAGDAGGYADAAAQDAFCVNTYCWITGLYDQSGKGNHLTQAPRGAFIGPAMGGFNNLPIADMAPITLMGHKVYGIFIAPDMGLRLNDAKGTAVDDQAEGQYWVINGHHFNDGCCFDYGNAETDSRDDGDGTMETTYFGNANLWYYGQDEGPWIMTDQENNLVGCVNPSPQDKYCKDLPSVHSRFVTATADGEPGHWRMMGGDAQQGGLNTLFDGVRIINERNTYNPMRKQGAIVLGNGGDNNNYSQGTFYEGAMTAAGTFPSAETNQKLQANIVAAHYDVASVRIAPAAEVDSAPGLQTFSPGTAQHTTVTFTNTTGAEVRKLRLAVAAPEGWQSVVLGSSAVSQEFSGPIAPGASVSATFKVTSGDGAFNGDLVGRAFWVTAGDPNTMSETAVEKVRNVSPIKINEFQIGGGENMTNSFIELYNSGDRDVDVSDWELTQHAAQLPVFSTLRIPAGTRLASHEFYVFGLSTSGLAVPVERGSSTIHVRSTMGMAVGDALEIGAGADRETRKIIGLSSPEPKKAPEQRWLFGRRPAPAAGAPTTVWQPLPDGPVVTIPKGSTNIPVESTENFVVGQKMAIGYGATYPTVAQDLENYETVTVTAVGRPGQQAWLSKDAKAGDTNIKVSSVENISVGDRIRLDIESKGHGIEWVTVTRVGTASSRAPFMGPLKENEDPGTGLDLAEPLRFDHASNMPFSSKGTGISFEPASAFDHSSNEPVLALCFVVTLDRPLSNAHQIHAVVRDRRVTTAGYQADREPNQWFGGPALDLAAGSMVLRDAQGQVVDSLNYGELVDPWASEGFHAVSGAKALGCFAPSPAVAGGSSRSISVPAHLPDRSVGRYPDGADRDSNCRDFAVHTATTLAAASPQGANNLKVTSVAGFSIGQNIIVGAGRSAEHATITAVGTAGAAKVAAGAEAGATVVPVDNIEGFSAGQTITIGSGENLERVVVASTTNRSFPWLRNESAGPLIFVTVSAPLKKNHARDEQVSGSGLTFSGPLASPHERGAYLTSNAPTPGAPNRFQ